MSIILVILAFHYVSSSGFEWINGFVFKDSSLSFQLVRILSYEFSGGSSLGECIATSMRINESLPEIRLQWLNEWEKIGLDLLNESKYWDEYGFKVSAHEGYRRAANYIRMSGFYQVDGSTEWEKNAKAFQQATEIYEKQVIPFIPYMSIEYIPTTWSTPIVGYLMKQPQRAPLLIIHSGYDGCASELHYGSAKAAYDRGYNVLSFDGPGQGVQLFVHGVPFRPDWENVVTPVIDYVESELSDIVSLDRIALMGRSMGGYLAPRACAFEHRIAACIADEGLYDFGQSILAPFPKQLVDLLYSNPAEFNEIMEKKVLPTAPMYIWWFFKSGLSRFNVSSYSDFVLKALEFTLKNGTAEMISCPTLVLDGKGDSMVPGNQATELYKHLTCEKEMMLFGDEYGAQSHCQEGSGAYSNERIMNWLDDKFGRV